MEVETPQPFLKKKEIDLPPIEAEVIKCGDLVVAFFDPQNQILFEVQNNGTFDAKFGHFKHADLIGKKYFSKIWSMNDRNYMFALKPNKTTFTDTMLTRTQILYHMDISAVILHLDLSPGMVVVESGTGSGSLSFAISQHLGDNGKLFTFEFNTERHEKCKEELAHLGATNINLFNRNAYEDGFIVEGVLEESAADAVFLDLPSPWHAVGHASKILKKGGRLCNFSPCIEQVQKTILELSKNGFGGFHTIEGLQRPFSRRLVKENSIYKTVSAEERERLISSVNNDFNYSKKEDELQTMRFEFSNGVGRGKWHTGYLTFCTKFR